MLSQKSIEAPCWPRAFLILRLTPSSAPGSSHHADHRNINLVGLLVLLVGQHRVEVLARSPVLQVCAVSNL